MPLLNAVAALHGERRRELASTRRIAPRPARSRSVTACMRSTDPGKHWRAWGKRDADFAVLSSDEYHAGTLDATARAEFIASGERQIADALETIRTHIDPGSHRAAHSISAAMWAGRRCRSRAPAPRPSASYLDGMLVEAARNAEQAALANITWLPSDDTLSRVTGTFDFIGLDHRASPHRPEAGYAIIRQLLDRLAPARGRAPGPVPARRSATAARRTLGRRRASPARTHS